MDSLPKKSGCCGELVVSGGSIVNCSLSGMTYFEILQTFCFNAPGDEFLFSTFMLACFDFLGQKTRGGTGPLGPSPC